jgi:hypothetical protein
MFDGKLEMWEHWCAALECEADLVGQKAVLTESWPHDQHALESQFMAKEEACRVSVDAAIRYWLENDKWLALGDWERTFVRLRLAAARDLCWALADGSALPVPPPDKHRAFAEWLICGLWCCGWRKLYIRYEVGQLCVK